MAAWSQFSDNGAPKGYGQPGVLTQRPGRGVTPQRAALSSALTREDDPDGLPPPRNRPKPVAPKQEAGSGAAPWDAAGASINAPRIVQRDGQTYLTEHGNWRLLQPGEIESATKYRDDFWAANPTGFQAGVGVQRNEDYANYGQEVIPGVSPVTAAGGSHAKAQAGGSSSSDTPAAQAQRYALNQALSPTEIMGGFSRRGGGGGGSVLGAGVTGAGIGGTIAGMNSIPMMGAIGGPVGAAIGAGVGLLSGLFNRRAASAPSDFSVGDARSAIQQAYRNYLGREASEAEIQSQLRAQGLKPGDSWVGEQGLGAVLSSIQGSEEAKQAAALNAALQQGESGGSGGDTGGGTAEDPPPPPAKGPYAGGGSSAGVPFEGFDFAREQDRGFSAKDSFAYWASQAETPPPGADKAALTDWFIANIQPGMEADGMVINWVDGDKFNFTSPQGTFTVDWVRGAGADGFGLSWQVEGQGGGGSGSGAGSSMQQAALAGALGEQSALDPGEAYGSSSNYLQYFLDLLRKNKVLDPNEPGVMTSRQRY